MSLEFPKESILGHAHTLRRGGVTYDVYKLIDLAKDVPVTTEKVAKLNNIGLEDLCWTDLNEIRFSPGELLEAYRKSGSLESLAINHPEFGVHIKRIRKADYSHPILMFEGDVIDGMHRLVKAIIDSVEFIPVKTITELPTQAIYNKLD